MGNAIEFNSKNNLNKISSLGINPSLFSEKVVSWPLILRHFIKVRYDKEADAKCVRQSKCARG